ncbi:MAG: hypothetical protein ABFS12_11925 [Bacteroidota bacterium]
MQYGYLETHENITGVLIYDKDTTLISLHKETGEQIFGVPSQLGLSMQKVKSVIPEIIKEALQLNDENQ